MNLKKAVQQMKRYSGTRLASITHYILLKDGYLTSTNLDVFVRAKVPFTGTGLIPIDQFKRITDKNEIKALSIENERVLITTGKGQFQLPSEYDPDDFPVFDDKFAEPFEFTVDKEVKDMKHFIGDYERYSGLFFGDGEIAATDAHKLKWVKRDVRSDKQVNKELFNLPMGNYLVSFNDEWAKFETGEVAFILRLVGPFVNYKPCIPEQSANGIHFSCDRKELIEQLENCLITTNQTAPTVRIATTGTVTSSDIHMNLGYDGKLKTEYNQPYIITLAINHLLTIAKTATTDTLMFRIKDDVRAVLINDDALLMPIKTEQ